MLVNSHGLEQKLSASVRFMSDTRAAVERHLRHGER